MKKTIISDFYESVILNLESSNDGKLFEQVSDFIESLDKETSSLEENIKSIMGAELSNEEKRVCILLSCLQNGKDVTEVEKILINCNMRGLYVRNLFEFVLHYALTQNSQSHKWSINKFNHLYNKCKKIIQKSIYKNKAAFERNDADLTLRELDMIVAQNTTATGNNMLFLTNNVTENVLLSLKKLECSNDFSDDIVIKLVETYAETFVEGCEITRYYFAFYVSKIIKKQIEQFLNILLDFTTMTYEKVMDRYSIETFTNPLSLYAQFSANLHDESTTQRLEGKKPVQIKKEILKCLANAFLLYGKSSAWKPNSTYLSDIMESLSKLRNCVRIFKDEREEMSVLREEIENLAIEDFYDYRISAHKLYFLLFERFGCIYGENNDDVSQTIAKKFMKGVLKGKCDLSRNAFMLFLSNSAQILKSDNVVYDREKDVLNKERFCNIITRCHFAPVSSYASDSLYFTHLEMPKEYFEQWKDATEDNEAFSYIPYEIQYISREIRKVKSIYKGVI